MNGHYLARNQLIQTIPCGHCWACKLNKSAEWATRCTLETLDHNHNYFITLTYDDKHLPIPEFISYKEITININSQIIEIPKKIYNDGTWIDGSLAPDDVTKFIHDIRQYFKREKGIDGIRYFYCGEYGETTKRPHYHMILYGAPLDLSQNYDYHIKNYQEHWKNPLIDKYWKHGMHDIANVEWSCCAYVARYTMKKLNDEPKSDEWYANQGKLKEFVRMSRMPGIGMNYYKNHKMKIYENDSMIMKTVKGNTGAFKPPKACDKLFKEEYPLEWKKIEKKRKECAERSRKNSYYLSDYTDLEKLNMKATTVITKANMLPRTMDEL